MKENIIRKETVPIFNITSITSKNDINYIKFESNKKTDTQNMKVKFLTKKKRIF